MDDDGVDLDDGIEEDTEVYPFPAVSRMLSASPPSPSSPRSLPETSPSRTTSMTKETFPVPFPLQTEVPPSHTVPGVEYSTNTC